MSAAKDVTEPSASGADPARGSDEVPIVDVDRLRVLLGQGAPVTGLDVRPAAERAEWSIPDSVHRDVYGRSSRATIRRSTISISLPGSR